MRGIMLAILAVSITVSAVFFILHREDLRETGEQQAGIAGLPAGQAGLPQTTPLSELVSEMDVLTGSDPDELKVADKYLDEALLLIEPKDRFVLIEKINGFKDSFERATKLTGSDPVSLVIIRATARYIAAWSPFYYYIHGDAQRVLGPVIKMLEQERAKMLTEFVKKDTRRAGQLATEDIEYYIEDIRKSAARRNSDFITFSLQDYEGYRKTFDELSQSNMEFLFGFAESAYILFDDFYRMHEEVDREYLDRTRKKVQDMRLEIIDLHKRALINFAQGDRAAAQGALSKTILAIENEFSAHPDWRGEIHDIMESDYEFYRAIVINP